MERERGSKTEELRAAMSKSKGPENRGEELNSSRIKMVAFSAAAEGKGHMRSGNDMETLVYNKVLTNIGNAYDSGIFTAPVKGIYHFNFFYHAAGARPSNLNLYKNNQHIVMSSDHKSADGADNGGNAVILQLEHGDRVSVRMGKNSQVWAGDGGHTTFSGFLICQL